jgi:hypothetical protein
MTRATSGGNVFTSDGTSSVEGVIKILSGPSILRVRKTTAGTFTANLVFIVWEFDA